jgi:hypothetical protein
LGACAQVVNDEVISDLAYEVPYRQGKYRLVQTKIGIKPIFGAGNTFWDKELLESVDLNGLNLAIQSEKPGEPNYDSEQKLKEIAKEQGWIIQDFS